jgi:hypothetical protein
MEPSFVDGLWRAFTGRPRLDTADGEALARNPLVPPRNGLLA